MQATERCPYSLLIELNLQFMQGKVYVMYIAMEEVHDYKHWMKLATVCTPTHKTICLFLLPFMPPLFPNTTYIL